ncbi:hypothetical protein L7F22_055760 [Adiantum nelumboides]|nr:hypothetical protein [Adiantum nelumboides]
MEKHISLSNQEKPCSVHREQGRQGSALSLLRQSWQLDTEQGGSQVGWPRATAGEKSEDEGAAIHSAREPCGKDRTCHGGGLSATLGGFWSFLRF